MRRSNFPFETHDASGPLRFSARSQNLLATHPLPSPTGTIGVRVPFMYGVRSSFVAFLEVCTVSDLASAFLAKR
jgi:hypothetical protein